MKSSLGLDGPTQEELIAAARAEQRRARAQQSRQQAGKAKARQQGIGGGVGGRIVHGKRAPLSQGTGYDLFEFVRLLRNAPQEESGRLLNDAIGGGDTSDQPSSGCPLSAAELHSLAGEKVDSQRTSTIDQYTSNARKLEFFLKYGHGDEIIKSWYQSEWDCALPIQSTDLSGEDAPAKGVRALKWASANFPGYYEAMKAVNKKPAVVSVSTFDSFAAALNLVYRLQVLRSNLADVRPVRIRAFPTVDLAFNAYMDAMKNKDVIDYRSQRDPARNSMADIIPISKIRLVSHDYLLSNSLKAFRDRCLLIFAVYSGARGDEIRRMRNFLWSGPSRLKTIGPCGFHVINYQSTGEKQHNRSDVDNRWFAPHRDALMCPQIALAFYLVARYTLGGEEFPTGEDDEDGSATSWRGECLFPQDKCRTEPMSYKAHLGPTKEFMEKHNIETAHKTHALRKTSCQVLDQAGCSKDTMARAGHWRQPDVMQKRYCMNVPTEAALAAGDWPLESAGKKYDHFFHHRFIMLPTESLLLDTFPFVRRMKEVIKSRRAENKDVTSQVAVVEVIEKMKKVAMLQRSAKLDPIIKL